MNREQQKILDLLNEFDSFCKKNGIRYRLAGDTLLYGYVNGEIEPKPYCASVLMEGGECLKFLKAFESTKPEGRELEFWGNSPSYPDYTVRYIASDTTAFSPYDCLNYDAHGMFVDIQILKGGKRTRGRSSRLALERGIELRACTEKGSRPSIRGRRDKAALAMLAVGERLFGKAKIRADLFNYFASNCSEPTPREKGGSVYSLRSRGKSINNMPRKYFENISECTIEGITFPVPGDIEEYLKKYYSKRLLDEDGYLKIKEKKLPYNDSCIVYPDAPYADIYDKTGIKKEEIEKIYEYEKKISAYKASNKKNNALATSDWQAVLKVVEEVELKKRGK